MFRILVVDDDPLAAQLMQQLMNNLQRRHEVYFSSDGLDALDFLHCRGPYADAPVPNLILLDLNMPRLGGLETLSAIKSDPDLCVIPVIMLSSANAPEDIRRCYQAHANCYVQKPTDLERSVKFIQAIEAFWIDFALLPPCEARTRDGRYPSDSKRETEILRERPSGPVRYGQMVASEPAEAGSQAMRIDDSPSKETATPTRRPGCEEHNRLLDAFGAAVQEVLRIHEQQFLAIVDGDTDSQRFDLLIHMANEKKQLAKYAYIRHVESHGCADTNALDKART